MTLAPGTMLGPYEILSPLGAGGMGEVFRARDEARAPSRSPCAGAGADQDRPVMKVAGRLGGREDLLRDRASLQRTLSRLRGTGFVPRGLVRFATSEEANARMTRQIVATHARRSPRTSPPSAGR